MLLCSLPLILTACGGSDAPETTPTAGTSAEAAPTAEVPTPAAAAASAFTETKWELVAIHPNDGDAITPDPGAVPTLEFNAELSADGVLRVVGFSGCNHFFGDYTTGADGSLSLPAPVGMTKVACAEPIQALETALLKSLAGASGYSLENGVLTIRSENGSLHFEGG
jgi:heat shock protein HslJ